VIVDDLAFLFDQPMDTPYAPSYLKLALDR
jgi:hypothetical protein